MSARFTLVVEEKKYKLEVVVFPRTYLYSKESSTKTEEAFPSPSAETCRLSYTSLRARRVPVVFLSSASVTSLPNLFLLTCAQWLLLKGLPVGRVQSRIAELHGSGISGNLARLSSMGGGPCTRSEFMSVARTCLNSLVWVGPLCGLRTVFFCEPGGFARADD